MTDTQTITDRKVRLGATLITYFHPGWWGLDPHLGYAEWIDVVTADPKPYYDRMFDVTKQLGLEGLEFAPDPGGWENALAAYGSAAGVKTALDQRGIRIGTSYQNGAKLIGDALADPTTEAAADEYTDAHARFVRELGGDLIVMGTVQRAQFTGGDLAVGTPRDAAERVADQIDRLGRVAGKHGVKFALHTDCFSVCSRNEDIAQILSLTNPDHVSLCLDAGHTAADGGDSVGVLRDNIDRVPVMHWKDCSSPIDGSTLPTEQHARHEKVMEHFRIFGRGSIDWRAWQQVLAANAWTGWAMAEDDLAVDPIAEVGEALAFYRDELEHIYR